MNTIEQISALESRQLYLLAEMKKSDDHAVKCAKLGVKFQTQYPQEYVAYQAANTEYNENETTLAGLYEQRAQEEAAEVHIEPIEEPAE